MTAGHAAPDLCAGPGWMQALRMTRLGCWVLALVLMGGPTFTPAGARAADGEEEAAGDAAPGDAAADEAPEDDAPEDDAVAETAVDDAAEASDDTNPPRPEIHKLYVPYRDLQRIFEKEGDGVFVPLKQWKRIWERAHKDTAPTDGPPVPVAIRSVAYTGQAVGERLELKARFEIDVLAKGWQQVPLSFAGLGVAAATLDNKPALLLPAAPKPRLLVEGVGRHVLDVDLQGTAPAKGDAHHIEFGLPAVPLARLALTVPGRDAEVTVAPRLASTTHVDAEGHTHVLAFLGPVEKLTLTWRRKPESAPTEEALLFAEQRLHTTVDRGVIRTAFHADVALHRGTISKLRALIPTQTVVLRVEAPGLLSWIREQQVDGHGGHALDLTFAAPVRDKVGVDIELEIAVDAPPLRVTLPWVALDGIERERGHARIDAAEGVKVEPTDLGGLVQVDAKELPAAMHGGVVPGRTFAYRFPARPKAVQIGVSALAPRLSAAVGHRLAIRPEGLDLLVLQRLRVERAGVFGVRVPLPPDLDVTQVSLEGAQLDDWRVRPPEGGDLRRVLHIAFRDRLLGEARVRIEGRVSQVVPEAAGETLTLPCPLLLPEGAEHLRGSVIVQVDAALERQVKDKEGLTVLDAGVAPVGSVPPFAGDRAAKTSTTACTSCRSTSRPCVSAATTSCPWRASSCRGMRPRTACRLRRSTPIARGA